ncbi:DUF1104 domain-containing protein [Desulfobulbus sp.]|uniref:DUF1104 domain-containing protein n=1 Tax=Desulfobulbus sp. TaxID=895 RepID=UPI00286F8642|nr:DUF1104 domain-containing protein [Desulfobulbus sp.]
MKKTLLAICCVAMTIGTAWAMDYSAMSSDQLSAQRGALNNASQEEWHAFHTEWWKRLSQMSPEERQKYIGPGMGHHGRGHGGGHGWGHGGGWCPWGPGAAPVAQSK